jgi:putative hydrolase of the HAD superfamily
VRLAALDAVTIDAYGTLLGLVDPIPKLSALLPRYSPQSVQAAFRAEAAHYVEHAAEGRDEATLTRLQASCTDVFNSALGSSLTPEQYIGTFEFKILPGVQTALAELRARGLALAVVANWDFSLHEHLRQHALDESFDVVVTSAETGARKPDPAPFRAALGQLRIEAARAIHVGDHPPHDEVGARAAGLSFDAAPLAEAVARWR